MTQVNSDLTAIGTYVTTNGENTSCANGTTTDIFTQTLSAGTWVVSATVFFNVLVPDSRINAIMDIGGETAEQVQMPAFSTSYQPRIGLCSIKKITNTTTVTIKATQNSGSAANIQCTRFAAVQIK